MTRNAQPMNTRCAARHAWATFCFAMLLCLVCAVSFARHHHREDTDSAIPGQFDYYLLALSWSPSYCLTHQRDRAQCAGKGFGFVLHGLWPQFDSGGYPQNCAPRTGLSAQAAALGRTLYPSPKLMEHEWERHGTCSGLDAVSYFRTVDRALAAVRVPAMFEAPPTSMSLSGGQIAAEFLKTNPALPPDGMVVACGRGQLSEVRVCLTRDLRVRSCGRGVRNSCPAGPVEIQSSR
jgi:ribonuclease T2